MDTFVEPERPEPEDRMAAVLDLIENLTKAMNGVIDRVEMIEQKLNN